MPRSTLTSKGQVTVPLKIRERLGLNAGDRLDFTLAGDGTIVVRPLGRGEDVRGLRGLLVDRVKRKHSVTVEEMNRGIAEAAAERYRRAVESKGED